MTRNLLLAIHSEDLAEVFWGTPDQVGVELFTDVPSIYLEGKHALAASQLFAATPGDPNNDILALDSFVAVSLETKTHFKTVVTYAASMFGAPELVTALIGLNTAIHVAEDTVTRKTNARKSAAKRNSGIPTTEELRSVFMQRMDHYDGYPKKGSSGRDEFWKYFQTIYEDEWPYDPQKHDRLPIKNITDKCDIGAWRKDWEALNGLIAK